MGLLGEQHIKDFLDPQTIKKIKKKKIPNLEFELKEYITNSNVGEMMLCPICKYVGKNKRGTAKIVRQNVLKCFSCGVWRSFE